MNNEELLRRAAKAAGYPGLTEWSDNILDQDSMHWGRAALHSKGPGGQCDSWNPLIDDGDALRLAVRMRLYFAAAGHSAIASRPDDVFIQVPYGKDPSAAVRRAITLAAAALGENIKPELDDADK
jgi:hypothetical protein